MSKNVPRFFKSKKAIVENKTQDAVKAHLREVRDKLESEMEVISDPTLSKRARGKRLLFLFQRDLLPGVNGKILETKANRDTDTKKEVTLTTKVCGWSYIVFLNSSMLFYIFLFALQQTSARQQAWLQSFLVWLVMQIFLIAPAVVYVTHVLIPSFTFKELKKIKNYLIQSFRNHRKRQKRRAEAQRNAEEPEEGFNAAEYLFVSYRLAKFYPDLLESKVILNFSTQWPVQTYHRQKDISKGYKGSFQAIQSGIANVIVVLITSSIDLPPSLQDMVMDMVTTVSIGYAVLLHIQLYQLYPVLVIIPSLVIGVIIHFIVKASRVDPNSDILPLLNDDDEDTDPLDTIKAIENIDTLQDLLIERDKKERRQRLKYQWADSTDGESKVLEERPQSAQLESDHNSETKTQITHESKHCDPLDEQPAFDFIEDGRIEQPVGEVIDRERGSSMKSDGSVRSAQSIKDEDLPASSRGSSLIPSPQGSIYDNDSPISSLVDSKSSISMSWYKESTSSLDSGKKNRWKSPAPWDRLQAMLNERASNAPASSLLIGDDNYSMPSKESVHSEAELSYPLSAQGSVDSKSSQLGTDGQYPSQRSIVEQKRWRSPARFFGKKVRTAREVHQSFAAAVLKKRAAAAATDDDDYPESKDNGALDAQPLYNVYGKESHLDSNMKRVSGPRTAASIDDSELHHRNSSFSTLNPAGSAFVSLKGGTSEQYFEGRNPLYSRARSFSGFSSLSALTCGSAAEESPYFGKGVKNTLIGGEDNSPNPSIYEPTSSRESEIESVQSLNMKELELYFSKEDVNNDNNNSPVGSVCVSAPNSDDGWDKVSSRSPQPTHSGQAMFLHVGRK